jgi:hypothetical protein
MQSSVGASQIAFAKDVPRRGIVRIVCVRRDQTGM